MRLTDVDRDKLLLSYAAELAQRRRERGLRLNYPETVALLSSFVLEGARDGSSVADLMDRGRTVLTRDDFIGDVSGSAAYQPYAQSAPLYTLGIFTEKAPNLQPEFSSEFSLGADHRFSNGGVPSARRGARGALAAPPGEAPAGDG